MELECSTCLESFTASSHLLSTPCGHIFHKHCINEWLDKGDLNCPQCTASITDFAELRRIYLPFITNNTVEEKVKTDLSDQKVNSKSKPDSIKKEWHDILVFGISGMSPTTDPKIISNDQVVTDFKLWVKDSSLILIKELNSLMKNIVNLDKNHL